VGSHCTYHLSFSSFFCWLFCSQALGVNAEASYGFCLASEAMGYVGTPASGVFISHKVDYNQDSITKS
jgi:hypothetical protein